jgi:hypothetical protein
MLPDHLEQSRELLRTAANKAQRTGNVPFPPAFVIAPDNNIQPPLARLLQGGRGGSVRLRLYLCITMMATRAPYDLKSPPTPSAWARLLALPEDTGARRVSRNLKWLSNERLIALEPRPGRPASITLLDAGGTGGQYKRPMEEGRYVGIPVELWTRGWILALSATALALLFALVEHQGGYDRARYVVADRRHRYGLSPDTWTLARKELERQQLLTVARTPIGSDFDYRRMRNTYWVDLEALKTRSPDLRLKSFVE